MHLREAVVVQVLSVSSPLSRLPWDIRCVRASGLSDKNMMFLYLVDAWQPSPPWHHLLCVNKSSIFPLILFAVHTLFHPTIVCITKNSFSLVLCQSKISSRQQMKTSPPTFT